MPKYALNRTVQFLLGAAAFVVIIAGMKAASTILVPFLLSTFFAIICAPPLIWLQEKKVPLGFALLIVIASIAIVQIGLVSIVSASLNDFSNSLPVYQARLQEFENGLINWLQQLGLDISKEIFANYFNPELIMGVVGKALGNVGNVLSDAFLILLLVIFMLLEATHIPTKLRAMLQNPESMSHFKKVVLDINRYLMLKTLISIGTGLTVWFFLVMLRIDYAILLGLVAFFLNYVPNIGSLIAAIPGVLLALVQLGPMPALYAGMGYVAINTVWGNIIEPRIMGRGLGLSELVVFLSLMFWGWVLGPVGMLLSLPLTMTVKIVLEANNETRWIAILLDSESGAKAALDKQKAQVDTAVS